MASDGPFACRYDDPHIEFERLLLAPGPDLFVMDEAHRIKNDGATLSKALARVASRKRVLLTGTPLQNNLVEYYHMVDFVSPGMLMGAELGGECHLDPIGISIGSNWAASAINCISWATE